MAISITAARRGDVVVVRLPKDKARPAVVVRSDLLTALSYATILPITTERHDQISFRVDIQVSVENGLPEASQVMIDWPQTIRLADMGAVIGRLDRTSMQAITRQLAVVLGMGDPSRGRRVA